MTPSAPAIQYQREVSKKSTYLDDRKLPDVVSSSLAAILARVDQLETAVNGRVVHASVRPSAEGVWAGDDFVI